MIAVDTNILVYAQRAEAPLHLAALHIMRGLVAGAAPWAVPWPCIGEYLRVVTHHSVYRPVTPTSEALDNLETLLAAPSVQVLAPTGRHQAVLREVLAESGATGDQVFDAQIFALCVQHGVRELLTADRGFRVFRGLKVTDPFA